MQMSELCIWKRSLAVGFSAIFVRQVTQQGKQRKTKGNPENYSKSFKKTAALQSGSGSGDRDVNKPACAWKFAGNANRWQANQGTGMQPALYLRR
jgi:hypothetical protein